MCPTTIATSDEKRLQLRGLATIEEVLEAAVHESRGLRSDPLPAIKFSNGPVKQHCVRVRERTSITWFFERDSSGWMPDTGSDLLVLLCTFRLLQLWWSARDDQARWSVHRCSGLVSRVHV